MSTFGFLTRNALRNKRRLLLSVMSVAVSLFLFVTLMVVLREFTKPPHDADNALRVVVRNKISIAATLPQRQRPAIEQVPGVAVVSPFVWFGGKFKDDEQLIFGSIAIEPDKLRDLMKELKISDEEHEEWLKDRTACIVGVDTMNSPMFQQLGYKKGSRFQLMSGFFPCTLDLKIVGTYHGTLDDKNLFFHHKYLDEAMGNWGKTGMWWLRLSSADMMGSVARTIEDEFANSDHEVRAESERAFQMSFISMLAGIKTVIGGVSAAVLLSIMFVTASTMSMSIRERFRELAILKAVGFQRRDLCVFILAESFMLSALGAVIGAGGAAWLYASIDIKKVTNGLLISWEVTPQMLGMAALVAAVMGIVSAFFPAIAAARMSVVEGLKTLD
jgi:putative ABC transport system permease protein